MTDYKSQDGQLGGNPISLGGLIWASVDGIALNHWLLFIWGVVLYGPSTAFSDTVYPKKYAHSFVVLCFVVVMQSFIMNSHEVFIHIHQGCFAGTGAIVRLPQCQWSKPDGYGKISQCITTTKHSKAKTVCIFLGIYCINRHSVPYAIFISFCYFMFFMVIKSVLNGFI